MKEESEIPAVTKGSRERPVTEPVTKRVTRVTGTRLPKDYVPAPQTVAWAAEQGDGVDAMAVLPGFVDHWLAASGARGVKADWEATFRNWVREEVRRGTYPRLPEPPPPPMASSSLRPMHPEVQAMLKGIGKGGSTHAP
ncbi:MAG: hypothetical protein ACYDC2_03235 [Solirubrobacteraceae bacterium]